MIREQALGRAIESACFFVTELSGRLECVDLPGVRGWATGGADPGASQIGLTEGGAMQPDRTIGHAVGELARRGVACNWLTGVGPAVDGLERRLEAAGLVEGGEAAGMALTDLSIAPERRAVVGVREVSRRELLAEAGWIAAAFDTTPEIASVVLEAFAPGVCEWRSRAYLACLAGRSEAVGFGLLVYLPDGATAVLRYAATRDGYRGRGVYRACLARRVADARAGGLRAVVLNAELATSEPICRRLGFREICRVRSYVTPRL